MTPSTPDSSDPRFIYCNSFFSNSLASETENLSRSEFYGTPYAFSFAVEPRLSEKPRLEGWIRTRIRFQPSYSSHEHASFSLAVPGPLVGGRAFLLLCPKVFLLSGLQIPWFPLITMVFHGFPWFFSVSLPYPCHLLSALCPDFPAICRIRSSRIPAAESGQAH